MSQAAIAESGWRKFLGKFSVMANVPRELWIVYAVFTVECFAYKIGDANVLTLWLSSDLGFSDIKAGAMVAAWSAMMTLMMVFAGPLTDAIGVRRTFLLGFSIAIVTRSIMGLTTARWGALAFGLYPQVFSVALMTPVLTAACKKFSNASQRSLAFALYYALQNLGYAAGDILFDFLRGPHGLGEHGHWTLPLLGEDLSTYRILIVTSAIFTVPGLIIMLTCMRDGVEMTEQGVVITPRAASVGNGKNPLERLEDTVKSVLHIFAGLWSEAAFYRFLLFMSLVVGVRMVFFHLAFTFPKYAIRELGDGAPFAHLSGMLNSMMIVFLVPICGALTQKISAYRMVTIGSFVSAASVFFIAVPSKLFQPLANGWLGDALVHRWLGVAGPVNPLWIPIFLFVVFLSLGEALWSPRLFEYAAAIAPKGHEASYMALSMLPFFLGKFFGGGLSGWLLEKYCPLQGPRNPEFMWLLVGAMAMITPLGTIFFRKHLQLQEAGREVITPAEAAAEEERVDR